MANATTTHKVKTRLSENSPEKVETEITIEWDSPEAERTFATRQLGIVAQAIFRASGDIPASYHCKVSELAKRERGGFTMKATPESALRLLGKLNEADMTAALTQLGMSKSAIALILANRPKTPAPVAVNSKPQPTPIRTTRGR